MKRSHAIVAVTIMLAVLCSALSLAAMLTLAWTRALSGEQAKLTAYAQSAAWRATISLAEIRAVLRELEPRTLAPCSDQHIARMRQLTINTRSIEEIGFFDHGLLKCTSWGRSDVGSARAPVDFTLDDGLQVTLRMLPTASKGNPMVAFQYHAHYALTVPSRFVDVNVDPDIALVIATDDGHVLGELNAPAAASVRAVIANPVNHIDHDYLAAVVRERGMLAIALAPRAQFSASLRREQWMLAPFGLLIAAGLSALLAHAARRRLSPLGELAHAVRKREFIVHYQPTIDLKDGHCVGAEALVRWPRPDGSLQQPNLFIPLAEQNALILPITDQVIGNVVRELGDLLRSDPRLHIAINLSAADIKSGRALDVIDRALAGSGIAAAQIWLEATERGFMDVTAARATLQRARASGHAIAIDDFGTGYSSLSHLQSLPLDALKIDKAFVDTIGTDTAVSSVTPHIIGMAKTLGLMIVAEGVETAAQADFLRQHQVDYAQGWLYAKAMPADAFIAYYRQHGAPADQGLISD